MEQGDTLLKSGLGVWFAGDREMNGAQLLLRQFVVVAFIGERAAAEQHGYT
jgi:hypothetical protein